MAAILGSENAVKERKIYSVCYCTLAPLTHDGGMSDALMDLSEFEIPILIFPMPCAGSTGPASLFSNVAMGNAEALSAVVLFQMAHPGTPLIYGDASGSTEFSSGGFLEGSESESSRGTTSSHRSSSATGDIEQSAFRTRGEAHLFTAEMHTTGRIFRPQSAQAPCHQEINRDHKG